MAHEFDPTDTRTPWHEAGIDGLAQACADHHEAGLRAHLAGGPTARQEIVDEVHAYVAEMIDDCDPCYQPTCDLLLDRLAESGDLPRDPMADALAPLRAGATDDQVKAIGVVDLAYSIAQFGDVPHEDWNLSDALDQLAECRHPVVIAGVLDAIRVVRGMVS